MRHRRYLYEGIFRSATEVSVLLKISTALFRARLERGWKISHDEFIPPAINIRNKQWVSDRNITKFDHKQLQKSFIGDSQHADNLYC